jgi:hypothetical protein
MNLYARYALLWFGLLAIAIFNGALRELVYGPSMSALTAHQLSTLIGCSAFFIYSYLVGQRWPIQHAGEAINVGMMWFVMTIIFESWMVLVLQKKDVSVLFHSYNIFAGQLWILVLLTALVSPFIVFRIIRRK